MMPSLDGLLCTAPHSLECQGIGPSQMLSISPSFSTFSSLPTRNIQPKSDANREQTSKGRLLGAARESFARFLPLTAKDH